MVDFPAGAVNEQPSPRRRRPNPRAVRLLGLLVVAAVVVSLIVQNSQRVTLRFWFVTGHVGLIWVILGCLLLAGAVGYLSGRRGRVRRRRRRSASE